MTRILRLTWVVIALSLLAGVLVAAPVRPATAVSGLTAWPDCTMTDDQLPDSIKGHYSDLNAVAISKQFECDYGGWYNYITGKWEPGWAKLTASQNVLQYSPNAPSQKITLSFTGGILQAEGRKGDNATVWWPPAYTGWDSDYRYRDVGTETWSSWYDGCCSGIFKPFTLENGDCPEWGLADVDSCTYDLVWSSQLATGYYSTKEFQVMIDASYQTSGQYFDTFYNQWRDTEAVGGAYVVETFMVKNPQSVDPITADFTSDEVESQRGTVQFSATAAGGKAPLRYFWNYGDGPATQEGINAAQHSYAKPGKYNVTLTVKDAKNNQKAVSHDVTIDAPKLEVAVSLPDKDGTKFEPGEQTKVRITVSASDGLGDLTQLKFQDGTPLRLDPDDDRFTLVSGPTPALTEPFTLAPGTQQTFDYEIAAGDTNGNVELKSNVSGKDAADKNVSADTKITVGVRDPVLEVSLTAKLVDGAGAATNPLEFDLEETDEGPTPREVIVTVKVKNISEDTIEDITIPGELELSSRTNTKPEPFPMVQLSEDEDRTRDSLGKDESFEEQYRFRVDDDGKLKVRALVSYANPSGDTPATLIETGAVDVTAGPGAILYFEAHVHGPPERDAGETYRIVGTVENRSTTQTLVLDPLFAQLDGNSGCGSIVIDGRPTPDPGDCQRPLFKRLKPNEKVTFHVDVITVVSGGTRSTVTFEPGAEILNDDHTRSQLTADDILVKDGDDGVRQTAVSLFDGVPTPDGGNILTWAINFPIGIKDSIVSLGTALPELLDRWPELVISAVKLMPDAASKAGHLLRAMASTMEFMAVGVMAIHEDPEAQAAFAQDVANYFDQELLDEVGMSSGEIAFKMSSFVDSLFVPAQNLLQYGDYDGFSRKLGQYFGDIVGPDKALKVGKVAYRIGGSLLAGASARVERAIQLAEKLPKGPPGLKNLPLEIQALKVGQELGQATLRKAFGVADAMAERLAQFAKDNDLIISLRFRQPESLKWINEFFAVLKPEAVKIKNVDRIDIQFLGYRDKDLASVIFKEPIDELTFEARIANEPANIQKLARSRYKTRVKEWTNADGQNMRKYDELGTVDVGLNYKGNGIGSDVRAGASDLREFKMIDVPSEDGTVMKVVFMADDNGILRRMTGDIDLVDVRRANGLPLSPAERADFYEAMQELIGLQHGETPTWVKDNDFLWEKKAELLADHVLNAGGEAVAQIAPDKVWRAVFIDPNLSYFDPQGFLTYIWWQGGYRTLESEAYSIGARFAQGIGDAVEWVQRPFVPPNKWKLKTPGTPAPPPAPLSGPHWETLNDVGAELAAPAYSAPGLGKCTWRFVDVTDALILTMDRSGELQQWDGSAWMPATSIVDTCLHHTTRLSLLPQSGVAADVVAGASVLPVATLADFAPGVTTTWFKPGMTVIIDPGEAGQEQVMVMSVDAAGIHLAAPLTKAHAVGQLVIAVTTSDGDLPETR